MTALEQLARAMAEAPDVTVAASDRTEAARTPRSALCQALLLPSYPPGGIITTYSYLSDTLLQAAAAGVVRYDAQQEAQCIAALLAEGCASSALLEDLPACVGVFTCASAADGGVGPFDGGSADGGSTCPELVSPYNQSLPTCSTDEDCAGIAPDYYQGPYCVGGICAPARCGIFPSYQSTCSSFAAAGERCTLKAFSEINDQVPGASDAVCAPGLGCQGRAAGGGFGTCVVPMDVGGACTDNDNCRPGLACACGTCEIPPATGPCANGLCELGAAYCDRASNTCRPVRPSGANCTGAYDSCAPGLTCAGSHCQPP